MMGSIVAAILILAIVIFIFKSLLQDTDYQTWLNILLVTVILLTVVMSIFMLLNKSTSGQNTGAKQNKVPVVQPKDEQSKNSPAEKNIIKVEDEETTTDDSEGQKEISEMSDEELSLLIAENYLILKAEYEKYNKGKDGAKYASSQIITEYDLTQEEWNDLYNKFVQEGYLEKAAKKLKK